MCVCRPSDAPSVSVCSQFSVSCEDEAASVPAPAAGGATSHRPRRRQTAPQGETSCFILYEHIVMKLKCRRLILILLSLLSHISLFAAFNHLLFVSFHLSISSLSSLSFSRSLSLLLFLSFLPSFRLLLSIYPSIYLSI